MPKGYTGRILRVDLTSGSMKTEQYDDTWYRTYYGGRGFNAYFLMTEVGPEVDALSPENKLIFSMGPLTGAPLSGGGRNSVGAKSPLTGGYGEGDVGGFFGAELKHAGFDAIVFEGRSPKPVYLWVHDGEAELRDATRLWGLPTRESQEMIREELGDKRIRTAQIGPGGENMVRYACVVNDLKHAAGRSGMGAVMGSKNLKAVAARAHKNLMEVADAEPIRRNAKWFAESFMEIARGMWDLGTTSNVLRLSATGGLPTNNFQTGVFKGAEGISGERMRDTIMVARENCYACVLNCKRAVKIEERGVDPSYGGPEYETLGALGSCCGVSDLAAVSVGNQLCNAYGIDTIAVGATIAWAMECTQRGILTKEDTDGIDLSFGNAEAMVQMIERICRRDGFGAVLAEGTLRASQVVGKGSVEFAMQVKGQEFAMHEPRIKNALGVGYSLSPTGADHCHNLHDTTQNETAIPRLRGYGLTCAPLAFNDIGPNKMSLYTSHVNWASANNCLGMCSHVPWGFDRIVEILRAATGWNVNAFELMRLGERMNTLCRAYNAKMGITAKDDTLPKRFFGPIGDPKPTTAPLKREEWEAAKQFYYRAMGWDENGIPSREKLLELGIGWVAEEKAAVQA